MGALDVNTDSDASDDEGASEPAARRKAGNVDGDEKLDEAEEGDEEQNDDHDDEDADGEEQRMPLQQSMFVHNAHGHAPIQQEPASRAARGLRKGQAWHQSSKKRYKFVGAVVVFVFFFVVFFGDLPPS